MKLFLISQKQNTEWDTYDSAVVAAPNKKIAQQMNPSNGKPMSESDWGRSWCYNIEQVKVLYLGEAEADIKQGVVCASFNAG